MIFKPLSGIFSSQLSGIRRRGEGEITEKIIIHFLQKKQYYHLKGALADVCGYLLTPV